MKRLIICFFILVCSTIYAQNDTSITFINAIGETTSVKEASEYRLQHRENGYWKRVVFDIKDDIPESVAYYQDSAATMQVGPYIEYYKSLDMRVKGHYANNKKTGLWLSWAEDKQVEDSAIYKDGIVYGIEIKKYNGVIYDSLVLDENGDGTEKKFWTGTSIKSDEGTYKKGQKDGTWVYYCRTGQQSQVVTYARDSAISYACYTEDGSPQKQNCYYGKEAEFKSGGDNGWIRYLEKKLANANLPADFLYGRISGDVMVQFVVSAEGKITDAKVIKSLDPRLDAIALGIIKDSPDWNSAVQFNRKVKAYRKQPITFALRDQMENQ